ncbi:MAG: EF-hand domain-containing protein [Alphaproteobacteria bacterium]|nr:EF-hand domain-containing protein [Alphaproteobacteria bacterium]
MIKIMFFLSLIFLGGGNVYAASVENDRDMNDVFRLTEEMLLKQAETDKGLQQNIRDRLDLLDINDDGFVSDTEIREMLKGMDVLSRFSEKEKKEMTAATEKFFNEADANHDHLLNKTEMNAFAKKFTVVTVKLDFKKRDVNGDGVIDLKDLPSAEESQKRLDEAMKKLNDLTEKMKSMNPEEMALNFMKNTGNAIAQEDFYRMDKDRNGCVSEIEYVDYQLLQQQRMSAEEKEVDVPYAMMREDFQSLYQMTKKGKPDCMTMNEYLGEQSSFIDDAIKFTKP